MQFYQEIQAQDQPHPISKGVEVSKGYSLRRDVEIRRGWSCMERRWLSTLGEWSQDNRHRTTIEDKTIERISTHVRHWQPAQ